MWGRTKRLLLLSVSIVMVSHATGTSRLKTIIKHPKSYIAVVWPITPAEADHKIEKILNKYGKIEHRELFMLAAHDATYLLKLAHPHIPNMREHVNWYFPTGTFGKPARVYIVKFDSLEDAVAAKHKVRRLFNLQYRAIHINDTHVETLELADFFFNRKKDTMRACRFLAHVFVDLERRAVKIG